VAVLFCLALITVLLLTVNQLPTFGAKDNPTSNEVVSRYITKGLEETGATNIVAGMILDYRAFDTLGESHVLFIAATCVMILLRLDSKRQNEIRKFGRKPKKTEDPILRMAAKLLTSVYPDLWNLYRAEWTFVVREVGIFRSAAISRRRDRVFLMDK